MLDLAGEQGRRELARLAATADVLIESAALTDEALSGHLALTGDRRRALGGKQR